MISISILLPRSVLLFIFLEDQSNTIPVKYWWPLQLVKHPFLIWGHVCVYIRYQYYIGLVEQWIYYFAIFSHCSLCFKFNSCQSSLFHSSFPSLQNKHHSRTPSWFNQLYFLYPEIMLEINIKLCRRVADQ